MTTLVQNAAVLYAANTTAAADSVPVPTTTEPTGDGIIEAAGGNWTTSGGWGGNQVDLSFFGAGADNATLHARITGWRRVKKSGSTDLWLPRPLLLLDLTLGQQVGVAGAAAIDTDRMADTIVVAANGEYTTAYEILSKADNTTAGIKIDGFGLDKIQVGLWIGTATNANALAAWF